MKNQNGYAALLMVSLVMVMVLVFITSASSAFRELYQVINFQQRVLASYQVTEDFAKMAQRANEVFVANGGACPAGPGFFADPVYPLCWPQATAVSPNANCVRHPMGDSALGARWICRRPVGGGVVDSEMNVVQLNLKVIPFDSPIKSFKALVAEVLRESELTLSLLVSRVQNFAFAQTSEMAHMPTAVGAPPMSFAAALVCPAAGPNPNAAFCKRCDDPASMQACVRFRVCLKKGGCDGAAGNNPDWTIQTVGLMPRR